MTGAHDNGDVRLALRALLEAPRYVFVAPATRPHRVMNASEWHPGYAAIDRCAGHLVARGLAQFVGRRYSDGSQRLELTLEGHRRASMLEPVLADSRRTP